MTSRKEAELLMEKAVKIYGKRRVNRALEKLYHWTSGYTEVRPVYRDFEPLTVFRPKKLPGVLYKGVSSKAFGRIFHGRLDNYDDWSKWEKLYGRKRVSSDEDSLFQNRFHDEILSRLVRDKLTSWTERPTKAVEFSNANLVLILEDVRRADVVCSVDMIPPDYRFSGTIKSSSLFMHGPVIHVPLHEQEYIMFIQDPCPEERYVMGKTRGEAYWYTKRTPASAGCARIRFHGVQWEEGEYLGDIRVYTFGLTKRDPMSWHVSPFAAPGKPRNFLEDLVENR